MIRTLLLLLLIVCSISKKKFRIFDKNEIKRRRRHDEETYRIMHWRGWTKQAVKRHVDENV